MDLKLLIDGIVRQTTVLIAQISTSAGVRSALSHLADRVFFELASEIEGTPCDARCAACDVPESPCGARCVQPCEGGDPAWKVVCAE